MLVQYWTDPKRGGRRTRRATIKSPFAEPRNKEPMYLTPMAYVDVDREFDDCSVEIAPGITVTRCAFGVDPIHEVVADVAPTRASEIGAEREF